MLEILIQATLEGIVCVSIFVIPMFIGCCLKANKEHLSLKEWYEEDE